MKRLIPAVILLVVILTIGVFSSRYIQNSAAELVALAEQCEEEFEHDPTSVPALQTLKIRWERDAYWLSCFVNHRRLVDAELELNSLFNENTKQERTLFAEHLDRFKNILYQIEDDSKLNLRSIV